ncbi:Rossmann-like domain-containing protein [Acidianus manzaensis]|uniref:Heavy-metal chelation domain-containing protein n=1 Tax=Acidianus manzaensis TaxID=282676 RepID=A0A1W6JYK7_9CREN|nr:DUF364 domain-containing protein [Acidianus manzaensis]ARM75284.1 hypothetical protein B6F84_04055 [Acidianus manzaensis]
MKLTDFLVSYAKEKDYEVKNVTIGLNWTCVLSKNCGIALTYKLPLIGEVPNGGNLESFTTGQLAELLYSWNLLEASVGLASINSTIDPSWNFKGNGLEFVLEIAKGKRVVMIGKFPGIEEFKKICSSFIVLELNPYLINPYENILPSTASESVIENSDILIVTSSTIINKSIDRLLELAKKAYKILVGPSTPMSKELLEYVDALAGIKINNPHGMIKKISQGFGMVTPKKLNGDADFIILSK